MDQRLVEAAERALETLEEDEDLSLQGEGEETRWLPLQAFLVLGKYQEALPRLIEFWKFYQDEAIVRKTAFPFLVQTLEAGEEGVGAFWKFMADAVWETGFDRVQLTNFGKFTALVSRNLRSRPDTMQWIDEERTRRSERWYLSALQSSLIASKTRGSILKVLALLKKCQAGDDWAYTTAMRLLFANGYASDAHIVAQEALQNGLGTSSMFKRIVEKTRKRLGMTVEGKSDGAGDLAAALAHFDKIDQPSQAEWVQILELYANRADVEGAMDWKKKMDWYGSTLVGSSAYAALLKACSRSGNYQPVKGILQEIQDRKITITHGIMTTLMSMFGFSKNLKGTEETWEKMKGKKDGPDATDYSTYLAALYNCRQFDHLFEVFQEIPEPMLSVAHYNQLIQAHVHVRSSRDEIDQILDDMAKRGIQKSAHTYNVLMKFAASNDDTEEAHRLFDELMNHPDSALRPAVQHYNILLSLYIRTSQWGRARAIFDEMAEKDIRPSSETKGLLLTAHAKSGTRGDLAATQDIIDGLVRDSKANTYYDTTAKGSSRADRPSARLFALASGGAVAGQSADLATVKAMFRDALRAGARPNLEIWGVLIRASTREGALVDAAAAWMQAAVLAREKTKTLFDVDHVGSVPIPAGNAHQGSISMILQNVLKTFSLAGWHSFARRAWNEVDEVQKSMACYVAWLNACMRSGMILEAFDVISSKAIILDTWHVEKLQKAIMKMERNDYPSWIAPSAEVKQQMEDFRRKYPRQDGARTAIPLGHETLRLLEERHPDLLQRVLSCREGPLRV